MPNSSSVCLYSGGEGCTKWSQCIPMSFFIFLTNCGVPKHKAEVGTWGSGTGSEVAHACVATVAMIQVSFLIYFFPTLCCSSSLHTLFWYVFACCSVWPWRSWKKAVLIRGSLNALHRGWLCVWVRGSLMGHTNSQGSCLIAMASQISSHELGAFMFKEEAFSF